MKTTISALLVASFMISAPLSVFAAEAETKKAEAKAPEKKAPDKGPTKKEDPKADTFKLRGR